MSADLAELFAMTAMDRHALTDVRADFDLAPFAECQRRGCVIAHSEGDASVLLICHDPLDLDAQQWFEPLIERLAPPRFLRVLVSKEDFAHFMASAEQGLRAMDTVQIDDAVVDPLESGTTLLLSIASIESTASPTVRLVD
ncbi:MAG: hypothetical protein ABIR26_05365, partial [Ramlibacter sp.]